MSWKTAKLIFYLGTLVSLALFLALTVDTHRQVETLTVALGIMLVRGSPW
jgi:hypothetical protein